MTTNVSIDQLLAAVRELHASRRALEAAEAARKAADTPESKDAHWSAECRRDTAEQRLLIAAYACTDLESQMFAPGTEAARVAWNLFRQDHPQD
jgi:hypothetical protein